VDACKRRGGGGFATGGGALLSGGGGSPAISPVKPGTCYRALINRAKTPKQRGRTGGFTKVLEGEAEAPVVQIGGEGRAPAAGGASAAPVT
jgi:hypothetical protein